MEALGAVQKGGGANDNDDDGDDGKYPRRIYPGGFKTNAGLKRAVFSLRRWVAPFPFGPLLICRATNQLDLLSVVLRRSQRVYPINAWRVGTGGCFLTVGSADASAAHVRGSRDYSVITELRRWKRCRPAFIGFLRRKCQRYGTIMVSHGARTRLVSRLVEQTRCLSACFV